MPNIDISLDDALMMLVEATVTTHRIQVDDKTLYSGGFVIKRSPPEQNLSSRSMQSSSLVELYKLLAENAMALRRINN